MDFIIHLSFNPWFVRSVCELWIIAIRIYFEIHYWQSSACAVYPFTFGIYFLFTKFFRLSSDSSRFYNASLSRKQEKKGRGTVCHWNQTNENFGYVLASYNVHYSQNAVLLDKVLAYFCIKNEEAISSYILSPLYIMLYFYIL